MNVVSHPWAEALAVSAQSAVPALLFRGGAPGNALQLGTVFKHHQGVV